MQSLLFPFLSLLLLLLLLLLLEDLCCIRAPETPKLHSLGYHTNGDCQRIDCPLLVGTPRYQAELIRMQTEKKVSLDVVRQLASPEMLANYIDHKCAVLGLQSPAASIRCLQPAPSNCSTLRSGDFCCTRSLKHVSSLAQHLSCLGGPYLVGPPVSN